MTGDVSEAKPVALTCAPLEAAGKLLSAREKLKDGDTIASEPPLDISDLTATSSEVLGLARNAMQNVESITAKIDQGDGTIGSLINDKRMYNQATAATAQAQAGAMAFDENMQALSNNFLLKGFFNRRGYENSADLTKYAVSRLPAGASIKTFVYAGDMIFDKKDGGSQIPFYDLSFLGGFNYVRGFNTYRYRGNNFDVATSQDGQRMYFSVSRGF